MGNERYESTNVTGGKQYLNMSASGLVKTGEGDLIGIWVASTSAGTLKLWDNTSAATTILLNTSTLSTGWNPMPFHFKTGLYITLANTMDWTVSYS